MEFNHQYLAKQWGDMMETLMTSLSHDYTLLYRSLVVDEPHTGALFVVGSISLVSLMGFWWNGLFELLSLRINESGKYWKIWRLLSYALLHKDAGHLLANMVCMYSCLKMLFKISTPSFIATTFVVGTLAPAIIAILSPSSSENDQVIIGASCGLFALIGALALLKSSIVVYLFFIIPLPAQMFVLGVFILSLYFHYSNRCPSIWHFGHAMGLASGFLLASLTHPEASTRFSKDALTSLQNLAIFLKIPI